MSDSTSLPEEAVNQWMVGQHQALVADLGVILDLEGGLREAMIPARHTRLVAEMRDVLDVDAGLNAIVADEPDTPPDVRSTTNLDEPELSPPRPSFEDMRTSEESHRSDRLDAGISETELRMYDQGD